MGKNKITQNGKTFTSNSSCHIVIGNKQYTGFKAWLITMIPVVFFIGVIFALIAFVFWAGTIYQQGRGAIL